MVKGKKIGIIGAGNVGATIAYTLTILGVASEIVLIDINEEKAKGEAMDIIQGTALCGPVSIYAGDYSCLKHADIVVMTLGAARKPGQTRIDLAQGNVNIIKSIIPKVTEYASDAIYVIVSNPVDIITYAITKISGLPQCRVIGSGTILDTSRLRQIAAESMGLAPSSVHAYVFGEHGDTAVIPWSLASIAGMPVHAYCAHTGHDPLALSSIESDVRTSGAKVIGMKGATYYAIAISAARICESILRDTHSILTLSTLLHGQYGIDDVCLSLPCEISVKGIEQVIAPPLTPEETAKLRDSADTLKEIIRSLHI